MAIIWNQLTMLRSWLFRRTKHTNFPSFNLYFLSYLLLDIFAIDLRSALSDLESVWYSVDCCTPCRHIRALTVMFLSLTTGGRHQSLLTQETTTEGAARASSLWLLGVWVNFMYNMFLIWCIYKCIKKQSHEGHWRRSDLLMLDSSVHYRCFKEVQVRVGLMNCIFSCLFWPGQQDNPFWQTTVSSRYVLYNKPQNNDTCLRSSDVFELVQPAQTHVHTCECTNLCMLQHVWWQHLKIEGWALSPQCSTILLCAAVHDKLCVRACVWESEGGGGRTPAQSFLLKMASCEQNERK